MKCPECASTNYGSTGNETICNDCGLVLDDSPLQDFRPEVQRSTRIDAVSPQTRQLAGRFIKTGGLLNTRQRTQESTKKAIEHLAERLSLPEFVRTEAIFLYMNASNKNLTQGRDSLVLGYACVYAACLVHELPRTPIEIIAYSPVPRTRMLRTYRKLQREFELAVTPMHPNDLLNRFATRLKLSSETVSFASEIIRLQPSTGRKPETRAAAALYVAAIEKGEFRTQRDVANSTGVIEVTIRKHVKEIRNMH